MSRITPQIKKIADLHIKAMQEKKFDNSKVSTTDEIFQKLRDGQTFEQVLKQIEIRYCSITSILMSTQIGYVSQSYKNGVYKGFKILLS